jgi:hypothetical protein
MTALTPTKIDELIRAAKDLVRHDRGYKPQAYQLVADYRLRRLEEAILAIEAEVPRRERTWESDLEEDR